MRARQLRARHHPHGGRPARHAGAPRGARARPSAALDTRAARLHRGAWAAGAARAHRPPLSASATASSVAPERVVVTTGSSGGFVLAFLAMLDAGDAVAAAVARLSLLPAYPDGAWRRAGPRSRPMPRRAGCRPLADRRSRRRERPAGLVVASPVQSDRHHGQGSTACRARRGRCRRHDVWLISDEIYHGIDLRGAGG